MKIELCQFNFLEKTTNAMNQNNFFKWIGPHAMLSPETRWEMCIDIPLVTGDGAQGAEAARQV